MASKKEQKVIDSACKRLGVAVKADDFNRAAAIEDLNFLSGDQWDAREKKRRSDKGRPALVLNLLPKFVDQVIGDMLHNTPTIKVRPDDSKADVQIAKIRQGIIHDIEYSSNSKGVYGYAGKQMVSCGYGGWRVLTRYTEDNPFLQEIYLESVRNPFLIYLDPSSKDQNYADAGWGFILEKMPLDDFKDKYPKSKYGSDALKVGRGLADEHWYDGNNITVAEYFEATKEKKNFNQLEDGRVVTDDEMEVVLTEWQNKEQVILDHLEAGAPIGGDEQPQQFAQSQEPEPKILQSREAEVTVIRHWVVTCFEILEGGADGDIFPGKYIPLVLLKGKELNIEGKNHVFSLIRHAKDSQKLINYWNSSAAETIALAPKAPWLGTPKQFEGFENDYAAANVENFPFLKYNADPEAPGPPQRQNPGAPPSAIFEQIRRGEENLKSVIGMFNADVGGQMSQQTGEAVRAVQKPGDVGTFEFMENFARAIMYTGRIINEMIPTIYDSQRDVRVRNIDESESFVPVNTTVDAAIQAIKSDPERYHGLDPTTLNTIYSKNGKDAKFNDVTSGKYNIVVTVGPSYSTQRQESAAQLLQLVQAMPQQMAVAADLLVESMDFKDADELATRLRKSLPPGMAKPRTGEPPSQPPPPPPQVQLGQLKLEGEKGKQQLAQMKIQQETIKLEHEKVKMQLELAKLQASLQATGQTDQAKQVADRQRLALDQQRLDLERERLDLEKQRSGIKLTHEKYKMDGDFALKAQQQKKE